MSMLKGDTGIGLLLFSCICHCDPIHELEFDVTPSLVVIEDDLCLLQLGEIKSSRRLLSSAVKQLSQRFAVLMTAFSILNPNTRLLKKGVVYFPSRQQKRKSEVLPKCDFNLVLEYVGV